MYDVRIFGLVIGLIYLLKKKMSLFIYSSDCMNMEIMESPYLTY